MNKDELKSKLEAVLFAWSDPISSKELASVLEIDRKTIQITLKEMVDEFDYHRRGIQILEMKDHYQMCTRPEHHETLQKFFEPKQHRGLTQAALETIAILAYKQPITKIEIEEIRGVKCDKALKTLLEKDLIEEQGRLERTGRPILYGTTIEFLKVFNLSSIEELPDIKNIELNQDNEKTKDIYKK